MKKLSFLLLLVSISLVFVGSVSASPPVIVVGTIYESDHITPIEGADIHIDCDGVERDTKSDHDGDYSETFLGTDCGVGDIAIVTAVKDDASGTASGVVKDRTFVDVAIINISLPEFGMVTAGLALLISCVGFTFLRKKRK